MVHPLRSGPRTGWATESSRESLEARLTGWPDGSPRPQGPCRTPHVVTSLPAAGASLSPAVPRRSVPAVTSREKCARCVVDSL